MSTVPLIKALHPTAKLIFNTRLPQPSIESFERTLRFVPHSLMAEKADFWFDHLPFQYSAEGLVRIEDNYNVWKRDIYNNICSLSLG